MVCLLTGISPPPSSKSRPHAAARAILPKCTPNKNYAVLSHHWLDSVKTPSALKANKTLPDQIPWCGSSLIIPHSSTSYFTLLDHNELVVLSWTDYVLFACAVPWKDLSYLPLGNFYSSIRILPSNAGSSVRPPLTTAMRGWGKAPSMLLWHHHAHTYTTSLCNAPSQYIDLHSLPASQNPWYPNPDKKWVWEKKPSFLF